MTRRVASVALLLTSIGLIGFAWLLYRMSDLTGIPCVFYSAPDLDTVRYPCSIVDDLEIVLPYVLAILSLLASVTLQAFGLNRHRGAVS